MTLPQIIEIEKQQMKESVPEISVGDTVKISRMIVEGKKQRVQTSEGSVIKMQHAFSRQTVTIRRNVGGVGLEQTFLIHSPLVTEIKVLKRGKVRRAKLFYLRGRVGAKANRLKTKD